MDRRHPAVLRVLRRVPRGVVLQRSAEDMERRRSLAAVVLLSTSPPRLQNR